MNLDVDFLIKFYKNNTKSVDKEEFTEQETSAGGSSAPSGGSGKAMPKWADVVGGPARGPANMLGKAGEKWDTGVKRGVANQIW
ncbi:MAG: hypothetical protein ACOYNN_17625 [Terrimicrobiaceae bacterium]